MVVHKPDISVIGDALEFALVRVYIARILLLLLLIVSQVFAHNAHGL